MAQKTNQKFCIVLTSLIKYSIIFEISQFCHTNGINFIRTMSRGVFGFIHNNFGENVTTEHTKTKLISIFSIFRLMKEDCLF